jgi:outer membrane immunogenic protein
MRTLVLVGIALAAAVAGPATAADMPVKAKAPPAAVAIYNWSGCYVGANVGGAWARQHATTQGFPSGFGNQAAAFVTLDDSSWIGGGHAGCNVQLGPAVVAGIEGDWSATRLDANAFFPNLFADLTPVGSGGITFSRSTKSLATIRGRLGVAVVPNALLYITGGGAWNRSDYAANNIGNAGACPSCSPTSFSATKSGYVVGGGVEWAPWGNNWLVRAEYLYHRFQDVSASVPFISAPTVFTVFTWSRLEIHEARVGLSYKFDWASSLVARY